MPAAEGPATMPDVARRAGVSVSTVSRTLRGLSSVSPLTRQRVEQAARELGFTISRSASGLVTGKTRRVAVMVWDLQVWFVGAVLNGLSPVLRAADLDLVIYNVPTWAERTAFFDHLPARRNADALLVLSFSLSQTECERLDELRMPVIFVNQCVPGRPSVHIDDVDGAMQGARHLVNLGHRRIAFLQGRDDKGFVWSASRRVEGFRKVMADAGISDEEYEVINTAGGSSGGAQAAARLLSSARPPTAVFAETDEIAMGALRVLRTARISVPESISMLGFDDHEMAELFDLSTVAQPAVELGLRAGELARAFIDDRETDPRHLVLPTRLQPRSSTAPVTAADADRPRFSR